MKRKIKNKIKQLLDEKKINKAELSVNMGKDRTFISTILSGSSKFFNLDHIEKICAALNYPVWKLFIDEEELPLEVKNPTQQVLLDVVEGLSQEKQRNVLRYAMEQEEIDKESQRGLVKKVKAAPGESGSRGGRNAG